MSLNQRIKEARLKAGYTQEQLGSMIGVAKTTVAGYEKSREPDAATIGLIIDALKVDANFLFQDEMNAMGGFPLKLQYSELEHIKKYKSLDPHGKEMVDLVLEKESERCQEQKLYNLAQAARNQQPLLVTEEQAKEFAKASEAAPDAADDKDLF